MYTLHTINHVTGEEQIREFISYGDAIIEFDRNRNLIKNHYGTFVAYLENTESECIGISDMKFESKYMDMYLERCQE